MSGTLEDLASAAEAVAEQQRGIARDARRMQRRRDRGESLVAVLEAEGAANLLARLRESTRRLGAMSARLAETLARELASEGESRRRIAQRLGVSHQRVSAILNGFRERVSVRADAVER